MLFFSHPFFLAACFLGLLSGDLLKISGIVMRRQKRVAKKSNGKRCQMSQRILRDRNNAVTDVRSLWNDIKTMHFACTLHKKREKKDGTFKSTLVDKGGGMIEASFSGEKNTELVSWSNI